MGPANMRIMVPQVTSMLKWGPGESHRENRENRENRETVGRTTPRRDVVNSPGQKRVAASFALMAELLAGSDLEQVLTLVAEQARLMAAARTAFIALPAELPNTLAVDVAVGADAEQVSGLTFRTTHTIVGRVFTTRRAIASRVSAGVTRGGLPTGPILLLPLDTGETSRGVLAVIGDPQDLVLSDPLRRHLLLFALSSAILIEIAEERRNGLPSETTPPESTVPARAHLRLATRPDES